MSSEYVLPMSSEYSVTYVPEWFKFVFSSITGWSHRQLTSLS